MSVSDVSKGELRKICDIIKVKVVKCKTYLTISRIFSGVLFFLFIFLYENYYLDLFRYHKSYFVVLWIIVDFLIALWIANFLWIFIKDFLKFLCKRKLRKIFGDDYDKLKKIIDIMCVCYKTEIKQIDNFDCYREIKKYLKTEE